MPILTYPIGLDGPVVPILIYVSHPRQKAMQKAGIAPPPPATARALLDTGASCTAVDPTIIQKLGLSPTGSTRIVTPSTGSTPHVCDQYDVALAFVIGQNIHGISPTIAVVESNLDHQGIQALIGRDVLQQGMMIFNGKDASVTLAF